MKQRIEGLDFARACAIFGMIMVNFKLSMNLTHGEPWLIQLFSLCEGRASALFVVLAGVGISLLCSAKNGSPSLATNTQTRNLLIKRGLLLIAIGLLFSFIWQADILHYYGVYFLIAAFIFNKLKQKFLQWAFAVMFIFPILLLFFNYEKHWDWATMSYQGFWTLDGMIRHILFNGFHPVFPWFAFMLVGMWLGHQNLSCANQRKVLLKKTVFIWCIVEGFSYSLHWYFTDNPSFTINQENINLLFGTSMMPPLPLYTISASSLAVIIIILSLNFAQRFKQSVFIQAFSDTGKMALTLYVAHVVIGLGIIEHLGLLENSSIETILTASLLFFSLAILFCYVWLKFFIQGPLEWLFRKLSY